VPYPPRPQLQPLPRFAGTATSRPDAALLADLEAFVVAEYNVGRSLREIAELTDRSHGGSRNLLQRRGVHRRCAGAQPLRAPDDAAPIQP
jgi:hypothetical protein